MSCSSYDKEDKPVVRNELKLVEKDKLLIEDFIKFLSKLIGKGTELEA